MITQVRGTKHKNDIVTDAVGLWVQVGFVEGIGKESLAFRSLKKALSHSFRNNRESAIMLWNSVPVEFDYHDDIPSIVTPLTRLLHVLQINDKLRNYKFKLHSKNTSATWIVDADEENIALCIDWLSVRGGYQRALNSFGTTIYSRKSFISEWKLLLGQCKQAICDSGSTFSSANGEEEYKDLCLVEERIVSRGRYYIDND